MLIQNTNSPTCLEDIFNDDAFGLLDISDEENLLVAAEHYQYSNRKGYVAGDNEITARQSVCPNFNSYKSIIEEATRNISTLEHIKAQTSENDIAVGDVYIFNGLVAVVVAINESEHRNSGQKYRAHLVYANGTESKLLFSSLAAKSRQPHSYKVNFIKSSCQSKQG